MRLRVSPRLLRIRAPPATPTEEALVRQMAMAQWRLRRSYHIEAAFFTQRMDELPTYVRDAKKLDRFAPLAVVANSDCAGANLLPKLSAIQARLERSFYRALQELQRLRAGRSQKIENQTQSHDPRPLLGGAGDSPAHKQAENPPSDSPFLVPRSSPPAAVPDRNLTPTPETI